MAGIGFDGTSFFNSVLASIALAVTWWALSWARTKVGLLNDRMTLRLYCAELERVEALRRDPSQVAVFLLTWVVICFAMLGIGIAYAPIAFMDGGAKWVGPFLAVVGLAIYTCAVYVLGILHRLKKGDAYLEKQRGKIDALQRKLGELASSPPEAS